MENYIIQVLSYLKITNYLESKQETLDYYVIEDFREVSKKHSIEFNENNIKEKFEEKFRCNTHPHQVYIEILSEHGLFGFIILISLFFFHKKKFFIFV